MMSEQLRRLATERRRRAVGGIMGYVEKAAWWEQLTVEEQQAFRAKVLASINDYHDLMLDMIRINDEGSLVNEETRRIIEQIRDSQRRFERQQLVGDG